MKLKVTVYMNRRDLTPWVQSIALTQQANSYYRSAKVVFAGFNVIEDGATWDIFGSYDPATPRSEVLLYHGGVPPDQPATVTVQPGAVPLIEVTINDWAWFAQRVTPTDTLVIAPSLEQATKVVEQQSPSAQPTRYQVPIGSWRWLKAKTCIDAIEALANLGGFNVTLNMPDYPLQPYAVAPQKTIWQAIYDLAAPYVPEVFFRRTECRVILADRLQRFQGVGSRLELPVKAVQKLVASPKILDYTRRVILQVPPWV
jgi:hypothetical protein